jgi:hypothetical protein
MVLVNQGDYQDPWRGDGEMGEAPWLHPTAILRNTELGAWTAIGPRCEIFDSVIGDWTYFVRDCQVFNAEIGRTISPIAAGLTAWVWRTMPRFSNGAGSIG